MTSTRKRSYIVTTEYDPQHTDEPHNWLWGNRMFRHVQVDDEIDDTFGGYVDGGTDAGLDGINSDQVTEQVLRVFEIATAQCDGIVADIAAVKIAQALVGRVARDPQPAEVDGVCPDCGAGLLGVESCSDCERITEDEARADDLDRRWATRFEDRRP